MNEHTVRAFDEELKQLISLIAEMGGLTEEAIGKALHTLMRMDTGQAKEIITGDKLIDALQRDIEDKAILMIAKRQPMGPDLREIVSALRICNDLERCGDLAKNVAKRVIAIQEQWHAQKMLSGVQHLADLAQTQLTRVLNAYVTKNADEAYEVWQKDEEIDAMYTSVFRELLTYMMENPRNITFSTHLLFCAKNAERIGDHATNIAETVIYLVTGNPVDEERPKGDNTVSL